VSSVTTFGIALWFNNADAGPFSIVIDQFADAARHSVTLVQVVGAMSGLPVPLIFQPTPGILNT
jgi:hypothetical protein